MSTTPANKTGPAYMSWGTLENLIERMDKDGVPPRIDRSILGGSEGYKTQVLAGLRWLELIEQDGTVTATLDRIVSDSANRQALVGGLIREKYPKQVELAEQNASQRALEESFLPYTGDTARKAASFFLKAAKFAGLPVSTYFKMPRNRRPSSNGKPAPKRKKSVTPIQLADNGEQEQGLHPALAGLLRDLPREGAGWTEAERKQFLQTFDVIVRYAIPVIEKDAAVEEGTDEVEDDE